MANGPHYPEGRGYLLKILSWALGKSAQKGTPQFSIKVKVLGKIDPDNTDSFFPDARQFERTINLYMTEKSSENTAKAIRKLGYDRTSYRYLDPDSVDAFDFAGIEFEGFCGHEAGQDGKLYEKWGVANENMSKPLDVARLEDKERRSLDDLFGKYLKDSGGSKPQPAAVMAMAQPAYTAGNGIAEITDDDIPF